MNKTAFTIVSDTGSALNNGTARSRPTLVGQKAPATISIAGGNGAEPSVIAAKQNKLSSALRSAQTALPWGQFEELTDSEKLFRLFRWACNQESLDFAVMARSERVFAVISMPAELNVSRGLLIELVDLLQQSNYDADAPEPKFGTAQKLLIRTKAMRNA